MKIFKFSIQQLSHLELDEGELRCRQVELELLPPAGAEPVVPHRLGLVPVVLVVEVVLVAPHLHLHVGVDDLALLTVVGAGYVLAREDLHCQTEAGELSPVQAPGTGGTVGEYRLSGGSPVRYF